MIREDMSKVLHAIFTKGIEIHLKDESFEIIKIDSEESIPCQHFTDWISIFVEEGNVDPKDADNVKNFLSINNLKEFYQGNFPGLITYGRYCGLLNNNPNYVPVSAFIIKSEKSTEDDPIMLLGIIPVRAVAKNYW